MNGAENKQTFQAVPKPSAAWSNWGWREREDEMNEFTLKAFERPDEIREFPFGRFEIVHIAGVTLGRATYQHGWKWSVHNAPIVGTKLCHAPHTGTVLSGHGAIQYEDGQHLDLLPGTV
jgi:hypothetical protein